MEEEEEEKEEEEDKKLFMHYLNALPRKQESWEVTLFNPTIRNLKNEIFSQVLR